VKHLFCVLILTGSVGLLATEQTFVSGQWKLHSSISGHESDLDCSISQKNDDLAGNCKSDRGPVTITGKLAEKRVTFQFKTTHDGEELTVVYTGTLESPARMAGTVDVQPIGVAGDFTATLVK
jgi:hypothetical protein